MGLRTAGWSTLWSVLLAIVMLTWACSAEAGRPDTQEPRPDPSGRDACERHLSLFERIHAASLTPDEILSELRLFHDDSERSGLPDLAEASLDLLDAYEAGDVTAFTRATSRVYGLCVAVRSD